MPENKGNDVKWYSQALEIFAGVSGWIAGPIIAALFLGKWLDKKYDSEPWLFLLCIGLAFAISSFGIVKITLTYIKKIEKEASDNKAALEQNKKINNQS
ncbi:MAG: AtpZ/AtpI family protein [Patescibacteria group bacterium]|jgi:MFS family permease